MQSIWHHIETWPVWKQFAIPAVFFTSLGLTLRDIFSFVSSKYHKWCENRIDNQAVAYLVREFELYPPVGPDSHGHHSLPFYRSSIQIAKALKRSAVDVRQRLERLERANRVERQAPMADLWTATKYEMHDKAQ